MALKGDLQNVQLADLFQTLSMNSQEGVLRLRDDEREHRVYFHPSGVTVLNPSVMGRRRLGEMLVEAELLTPGGLETALAIQAQTGKFLGEVLVERGMISREQLELLLTRQVEEEIYSLFHLHRASFEFREGPPVGEAPPVRAFFHTDAIVLEAARRVDEWAVIKKHIPDLNRIYVRREGSPAPPEEAREIHRRLDGTRTLLDVADSLLASSFQVAKRAAALIEAGCIRPADETELVTAARTCLKNGKVDHARMVLHQALARIGESSAAMLPVVTGLFSEAGDDEGAASAILRIGRLLLKQGDTAGARSQLEKANALSPADPAILSELVGLCRRGGQRDDEMHYLGKQVEVLADRQQYGRALACLDRLRELAPNHEMLARHYVAMARGCARPDKGVTFLEGVLEEAGGDADPRALSNVYRQILELDPQRVDIAARLRRIDVARKRILRFRIGLAIAAVVVLVGGGLTYAHHIKRRAALADLSEVTDLLAQDKTGAARGKLGVIVGRYGKGVADQEVARLRKQIEARSAENRRRAEEARRAVVARKLGEVQELLDIGSFAEALTAFLTACQSADLANYREAFELKLASFEASVRQTHDELLGLAQRFTLPGKDEATEPELHQLRETFSPIFENEPLGEFLHLRRSAERAAREAPVGKETLHRIAALSNEIVDGIRPVREGLREIDNRLLRLRSLADMGEDYELALAAESRGRIAEARDLYRNLLDRYGDGELTPVFRKRLEHVVKAQTAADDIETKIAAGRVEAAHADAYALIERFPDLHLEHSLLVPVQISILPLEARISLNAGEMRGNTLRLPAHGEVEIRSRADGFDPYEVRIDPAAQFSLDVSMHRAGEVELELQSPVEAPPLVDGHIAYIGGRDGHLRKVDLTTGEAVSDWDSGSVFGIRSRLDMNAETLFVVTAEGSIHALAKRDFEEVWARDLGGESRCGVRELGEMLVTGNEAGELVAIDSANGRILWRKRRPGALRGPPVEVAGLLFAGFGAGHLLACKPANGEEVWEQRFGDGFVGSPVASGKRVIVATDTGRVLAFNASDGTRLATYEVGELPVAGPLLAGEQVFVAAGNRIVALDSTTLELRATFGPLPVAGAPAVTDDRLYAGGVDGYVYAFARNGGPALWRSPLAGRVSASPVVTEVGLLVASESGRVELLEP